MPRLAWDVMAATIGAPCLARALVCRARVSSPPATDGRNTEPMTLVGRKRR